jgi:hypothetical protein
LGILVAFGLIAVSVSAWGSRGDWAIPGRPDLQVIFGSYHCGMGQGEGFVWASFQSTGDLVPADFIVQRGIRSSGEPGEVCAGLTSGARRIVRAVGCRVGPDETRSDETGASIDFGFVCHDERSRLTRVLADLGSSVVLAAP